ncbi:MAG TPA: hypothetical protein VMZ69_06930 [Saprospiraceae bacterium]|nr:hypothetical protein [Saprospiraceae bacterium]
MKKNLLRIALAGFLFAGLSLLGAVNQVQAQNTVSSSLFDPATGPFVSKEAALDRLNQAIVPHKIIMEAFPPLSFEHKQALKKYTYFNTMINLISNSMSVPESIGEGLKMIATDVFNIPVKQLGELKQEAIAMLRP